MSGGKKNVLKEEKRKRNKKIGYLQKVILQISNFLFYYHSISSIGNGFVFISVF